MCRLTRELYVFYSKGACVCPLLRGLCLFCDKGERTDVCFLIRFCLFSLIRGRSDVKLTILLSC